MVESTFFALELIDPGGGKQWRVPDRCSESRIQGSERKVSDQRIADNGSLIQRAAIGGKGWGGSGGRNRAACHEPGKEPRESSSRFRRSRVGKAAERQCRMKFLLIFEQCRPKSGARSIEPR